MGREARDGRPARGTTGSTVLRKRLLSTDLTACGGNRQRTDNGIKYRRKLSGARSFVRSFVYAKHTPASAYGHLRGDTPLAQLGRGPIIRSLEELIRRRFMLRTSARRIYTITSPRAMIFRDAVENDSSLMSSNKCYISSSQ